MVRAWARTSITNIPTDSPAGADLLPSKERSHMRAARSPQSNRSVINGDAIRAPITHMRDSRAEQHAWRHHDAC